MQNSEHFTAAVIRPTRSKREKNILDKRSRGDKILFAVVFALFVIHSLTLVFPMLWMLMSSFKGALEYAAGNAFALPDKWLFGNYAKAFQMLNVGETNFFGMIFNSLWYTITVTLLGAFVPSVTGYVLSKYQFKGRTFIFTAAITSMTIPIVGNTASYMKLVAAIGVYDNPLYAVVTSLGGFSGTFLVYYGFFKSISWAYAEATMLDGGGPFTIFFRIMLPQALPILMTYAITGAITNWNEYNTMILYLPSYPTLASGLFEYQSNAIRMANYPVYFAGLIISMIPTLILFGIFSDKVMTSLSFGGLKG